MSTLRGAVKALLPCVRCHAVDCHRDGLSNAAAQADAAIKLAEEALASDSLVLRAQVANAELQIAELMRQRSELRKQYRGLLRRVAEGSDPELAVQADAELHQQFSTFSVAQ